MRLVSVLSGASTLVFVLIGVIIAGNDLLVGYKSSLPGVSAAISVMFVGVGIFMWRFGRCATGLSGWIMPEGLRSYKRLNGYLSGVFAITLLLGIAAIYGVISRINQGFSIFG